jgi:hypothetical protein
MITQGNRRQGSDTAPEPRDPDLDDEDTSVDEEDDEDADLDEPEDEAD